jgi:uncharacterized protein (DUF885 family)
VKKLFFAAFALMAIISCKQTDTISGSGVDAEFDKLKGGFIEELWEIYPGWANSVGYRKYDSVLVIPNESARNRELKFAANYLDSLKRFKLEDLSSNNKTDYRLIENQLRSTAWSINEFKAWQWDPSSYNVGDAFALLLTERYAPLDQRLHSFGVKLKNVPAYYQAARKNIDKPTIVHTDLAIDQNEGLMEIFGQMLQDSLKKSNLSKEEKAQIIMDAQQAKYAILDYVGWLRQVLRPTLKEGSTARSFRIGKELYEQKFRYDLQSGYTPDQIYEKALLRKAELHREMEKLASELWQKYFGRQPMPSDKVALIKKVIDTLSTTHASRETFQASVEKQLPELVKFISEKNLLYIDPKKPLVVRQTPAYMEGVSVASINSPGPYDKEGNTYYNVGSLKRYDDKGAESFLREYNKYTLQIINIHEAIPGHYTQLVYSNQSPSLIKSILGNGNMVEGWAVYTERMMLEEGYGNNDPAMWLMYYKWHLRAVCNTILDYSIHNKSMTEEQALDLMMREAFQQEAEARGKWRRATLTQVQLCSYFTGYSEIYDLREELKKKQGKDFNLKEFHEKFLSYGSAPVKYIRELMLEEQGTGK